MAAVVPDFGSTTNDKSIDLGPAERIPLGQGRCFTAGDRELAVFRFRDARVFAIDNICPHRRGPLSAGVAGVAGVDHATATETVVCPLHGFRFSLRDGRGLDSEMNVRVYRAEIRDGRISVWID